MACEFYVKICVICREKIREHTLRALLRKGMA